MIRAGAMEAVTGWHISAVREAVAPVIGGRVPYAYIALYEGGEHRPGVFPDRRDTRHPAGPGAGLAF